MFEESGLTWLLLTSGYPDLCFRSAESGCGNLGLHDESRLVCLDSAGKNF